MSWLIPAWLGVAQRTAWKMGHAIRLMMDSWAKELPLLSGTIEMDEKFIGGKPRHRYGVRHKSGKATAKQSIFLAIQRQGPVFPVQGLIELCLYLVAITFLIRFLFRR